MGVRRTLVTAGLVVAAVVTGMWVHAWAQAKPAFATIVFSMSNGKCVKKILTTNGDKVRANRGSAVRWTVSNSCDAPVVASVRDFTYGGASSSPFLKDPGPCTAAPGDTCPIDGVVRQDARTGTYKYAVYDGTNKKDPDLIIDP